MKLIPITDQHIEGCAPYWFAFLPSIARRTKESIPALVDQIRRREVRVTLIWDEVDNRPVALIGTRFHMRGHDLIAEWVWMTGHNYKAWKHLLPEFENLLRQAGAVECRPLCRPGWARILKAAGYRLTHIQMEKSLG